MAGVAPSRIAQIAVTIGDLERAKSFYGNVLGLEHLFDAPPGLSFFRCGETRLMLSQAESPDSSGSSILYYGVEDVEAAHRTMTEAGMEFAEAPRCIAKVDGRDVWLAICPDGEGNLLGLISG
jgi:methylmalonyl-CoA/ethylmalonyl-CoA epimerase